MLKVDTIKDIRIARFVEGKGIREIARDFNISRNTVRSIIRSGKVDQSYCRLDKHRPKLGAVIERLVELLTEDEAKPVKHRRRAQILFEQLQREGYDGGYDAVRRYVGAWRREQGKVTAKVFIPLEYDPGDAFQFDWSYEQVELGGVQTEVKIAQFRLCHSRKPFCIGYTRESLEMILDAHSRAFEFFNGICRRGIYDNLKTVVTKVLMGKDRIFNRRFQNLASYYLFDPVACTPAAGWEKGQVENQVGLVRNRFFAKRRRFASLDELNEWLEDECRHWAATAKHPELKDRTIDQVYADEKKHLLQLPALPFDGYLSNTTRVSTQLLVSFDRNRYSVNAMAAGKSVEVRAYSNRVVIVMNDTVVGIHKRNLGRDKVVYDPWHYLAVLEQKPGALRNGAPFKQWNLPEPINSVRSFLETRTDGDRQFVAILSVVKRYGLEPVAQACAKALSEKTVSSDVILAILSRQHDEPQPAPVPISSQLPLLTMIPVVDCYRYDGLLRGGVYGTA
jgi:transposase